VDRLEKLTGKAAKPPAAGGGGDKKLTADEWLAKPLKKSGLRPSLVLPSNFHTS